jgi:signal transduction histidine kinase
MASPTIFDREQRIVEHVVRPLLTVGSILVTVLELRGREVLVRPFTIGLFAMVAALSVVTPAPWRRRPYLVLWILYAVGAAVLLPLAQNTLAQIFPFLATAGAGERMSSRRTAVAIAVLTSVTATVASAVVHLIWPDSTQFAWWEALVTGLPSYIGIARTDRAAALASAQRAAVEARRAADSEAREAALLERSRIARELHDVLGHSLTGIALQLDMADALNENNRRDEATQALRSARKLAVDSIADMRGAVHALREETVPRRRR